VPAASYFGLQAAWGVTKHMGGRKATDELAALARIASGVRVLEIGCGTGVSTCYLAQRYGCRIVAVDISADMVRWASQRVAKASLQGQIVLKVADAHDLPFEDDQFDAAICESVTAFLDKPRAIGELRRVVRPGGRIGLSEATWIRTPPSDAADYLHRALGGAEFLTPEAWRAALETAGLAEIDVRVHSVSVVEQWASEMRQLSPREYLVAWRTVAAQLRTSADIRHYVRTLWPPPASILRFFGYVGYGIYVGTEPPVGSARDRS
jgi:SAM-dependent methyltransferase